MPDRAEEQGLRAGPSKAETGGPSTDAHLFRRALCVRDLRDLNTAAAEIGVCLAVEDPLGAIAALLVDVGQGDARASRGVLGMVHHHNPGDLARAPGTALRWRLTGDRQG
ncbi:hypothetical protein [Streptomyces sp. NPDC057284]|uniref:hypothetical protein n=1 Tax=Streptomyces sp. NPDC057284 TaxID=3346083 RepID=UPI00363CE98D